MIKREEYGNYCHGHSNAEPYVCNGKRKYRSRAEQSATHVRRYIRRCAAAVFGSKVHQQIAYRERSDRYHSHRSVSLDFGALTGSEQQDCRNYRYRHNDKHIIGYAQDGSYCHCPERNVRKSVTDERKTLHDEGNSEKRSTQCNEKSHDERIADCRELEI